MEDGLIGSGDEGGFVLTSRRAGQHGEWRDRRDDSWGCGWWGRAGDDRHLHRRRLAYSLSPSVVAVVIDFDGGGRFQCELTDVDPTVVAIGDRVEMTFAASTRRTVSTMTSEGPADQSRRTRRCARSTRRHDMASHGYATRWRSSTGRTPFGEHWNRSTDDLLIQSSSRVAGRRRHPARRRRVLAGDRWLGDCPAHAAEPAQDRSSKPVTHVENDCATGARRPQRPLRTWRVGAYDVVMAIGVEKLRTPATRACQSAP